MTVLQFFGRTNLEDRLTHLEKGEERDAGRPSQNDVERGHKTRRLGGLLWRIYRGGAGQASASGQVSTFTMNMVEATQSDATIRSLFCGRLNSCLQTTTKEQVSSNAPRPLQMAAICTYQEHYSG